MASPTQQLTKIRERKAIKAGAKRKNKVRRLGTTAIGLPLNMPNANEKKQIAARAKNA